MKGLKGIGDAIVYSATVYLLDDSGVVQKDTVELGRSKAVGLHESLKGMKKGEKKLLIPRFWRVFSG